MLIFFFQIEGVISSLLGCVYDAISTENSETHKNGVRNILVQLEAAMSFQYQAAWPCVIRLLGQCYSELGLYYGSIMMPSLKTLCEMMGEVMKNPSVTVDEAKKRFEADLEKSIGKAIQGIGVESVLACAPMNISGDITKDVHNIWVLPILRKYVRGSRLMFFYQEFIPMANKVAEVVSNLEKAEKVNAKILSTYKMIESQIWSLLPSFSREAVDVEQAQGVIKFAKLICELIQHERYTDSRVEAMRALRSMVTANPSKSGRLAKNSNNYMPALFNLYVMKPTRSKDDDGIKRSDRAAALATIQVYLPIVPDSLCLKFIKNILAKIKSEEDQHIRNSMLTLAQCFINYISAEAINELYQVIVPLIHTGGEDPHEVKKANASKLGWKERRNLMTMSAPAKASQKVAYKVLESILSAESQNALLFIHQQLEDLTELLLTSVSEAAASSRAVRLRCAKVC